MEFSVVVVSLVCVYIGVVVTAVIFFAGGVAVVVVAFVFVAAVPAVVACSQSSPRGQRAMFFTHSQRMFPTQVSRIFQLQGKAAALMSFALRGSSQSHC